MMRFTNSSASDVDDVAAFLAELDKDFALQVLAAILVLCLLALLGVVGNSLVCYIYICRFKKAPTQCFIVALAVFDLINCFIGIPVEIIDMRYNFTYGSYAICGFSRMFVVFTAMGSGSVLVAVAADRYKQICQPLRSQTTLKMAKIAVSVCSLLAFLMSLPAAVIYGGRTVPTDDININGSDCSTADEMIGTPFPLLHNGVQFLIFLAATVTIVVLYSLIWKTVRRQHTFRASFSVHKGRTRFTSKNSISSNDVLSKGSFDGLANYKNVSTDSTDLENEKAVKHKSKVTDKKEKLVSRQSRSDRGVRRTTFMLFLITLVFVLSYLPHLALMAARAVHKSVFENLQGGELAAYNLFLRSYFFNSASNPIIYSLCNGLFRRELKQLVHRLTCRT